MRQWKLALAAVSSLSLAACLDSAKGPTSPEVRALGAPLTARSTATNVTTTVFDADTLGNPLLTRSDDYNGSGFAAYTSVNNVNSYISSDGTGWELVLGSQTVRTLYLVLASQGAPMPDGNYSAKVEAYSRCFDANNNPVSLLAMGAETSNGNCSFGVDFAYNGTKYKLAMGPTDASTGRSMVTCTAAANGSCTNWSIAPNDGAANARVANLYYFDTRGHLVPDGVYHDSYRVAVAR